VSAPAERDAVYVWDLVVRLTHWFIVLSIFTLSATGFYIGRPFAITHGGFGTGWVRVVHFYSAAIFTAAVAARVLWMVLGPRFARWTQLVPTTKQRRRDLWGTFKFYSFMSAEPPPATGHNSLAGMAYLGIFGLYIAMIATGIGLYAVDSAVGSPSRLFLGVVSIIGGPQNTRWLHHVGMWILLAFMIQHVYSAMLMARVEKNGGMDSIFSGWKFVRRNHG
jgi:Ni/Fe-hydrogenase 1 B-type cytochrome subunit